MFFFLQNKESRLLNYTGNSPTGRCKGKGAVVPVFNQAQRHEDEWKNGKSDPRTLNFGYRCTE
jgi:hypothetical protein